MLLASKASLVARKDMHPALQYLFLDAASQVHSGPGFFQKAGQFPAPEAIDLPLSADARHFYKSGPPFLQRYLPFLLAVLGEKLLILLIPLFGIVYPLLKYMPAMYQWAMRRRIFRIYKGLKWLEMQLVKPRAGQDIGDLLSRLARLEARVDHLRILGQAFREGPTTSHRITGAVAAYLLLGQIWSLAYYLVELGIPGSFSLQGPPGDKETLHSHFFYFSFVTLTTLGYGDIVAVHPMARMLVILEGVTGQLFPAILISRLVSLHVQLKQKS